MREEIMQAEVQESFLSASAAPSLIILLPYWEFRGRCEGGLQEQIQPKREPRSTLTHSEKKSPLLLRGPR